MTCRRETALNAATILLTEDHHLVEALHALSKGRQWFRPDYDQELIEVEAHLSKVADEACTAWMACRSAGLDNLAKACGRIDMILRHACAIGPKGAAGCKGDLIMQTQHGKESLDVAEAMQIA